MEGKILFLDLDGTLLNDRKECTEGNRRAIAGAIAAGHRVVIASGRPLKSTLLQAEALDLSGPGCYVIAYNGAVIYDCARREELFRKAIALEDLYAVFDEANRRGIHIQTYDRESVIVESRNDNENVREYCRLTGMEFRVIEDIRRDLPEPPMKALLIDFRGRTSTEAMEAWLRGHMRGKVDCYFSSQYYLEVVPVGMHKGRAVTALCQQLGIPIQNAVAVGDEANDIPMLRSAGIGAAMQNAGVEVKAAADYITQRDNNHDGAAEVIDRFLRQ